MQHEIGEQGAQACGIEAGHLLVAVEQAKIAEQADVKGWHRHDRLPFSSSGSSDGREGRIRLAMVRASLRKASSSLSATLVCRILIATLVLRYTCSAR